MTSLQRAEIGNYLLSKKLPIDILLEVQDHFVSQINDLEREEGLGFDEAFKRVKSSWQSELQPYWDGSWDLQDRSKLLRRINRTHFISLLKKGSSYMFIVMAVLILMALLAPFSFFKISFILIIGTISLIPIWNYFANRKDFRACLKIKLKKIV